jgi:hypothetical protein
MITRGQVIFFLASIFIVVAAWVGFNVYHHFVTSTITSDLQMAITPITPDFDTSVLEKLRSRERVVPDFQFSGGAASNSGEISITPATPSIASSSASSSALPELEGL